MGQRRPLVGRVHHRVRMAPCAPLGVAQLPVRRRVEVREVGGSGTPHSSRISGGCGQSRQLHNLMHGFNTARMVNWVINGCPLGARTLHGDTSLALLLLPPSHAQAVATETVEAIEATNGNGAAAAASSNGNGNSGSKSNGNGSNGNGAGSSNLKVILPAAATAAAAAAAPSAAAALSNGKATAAAASEAERMRLMNTIDEEQNAEAAGQLELAAATARERKDRTAAGTPYKAPGGNWSKFKTYSVWQVCVCGVWCVAAWCRHVCVCVVTEGMHAAGSQPDLHALCGREGAT